MKKKLFLILLCALTGMAAQAQTIRYVKPTATGSGDGSTWANASGDLQAMINASAAGDEVWVAAGTYKPNAYPSGCSGCSTNRDFTFHLKDGVKLYGGFAGAETLLSQRNIAANPTTLSGDFNNDDVVTGSGSTLSISGNGENAYHVVLSVSDAATTVLDGFTVSGGNADGDIGSNITVETHSIFKSAGGGISNTSSSPTITNITIIGNSATFGGGLDNYTSSSPSITNTTFISNLASFGGAMNTETTSSPTITNTTITGNSATNTGGGMYNRSSSNPDIRNSIIWGNGTTEIVNNSSAPTVSYSIVQGGYAGCSNCPNTNGNANPLLVNAADPAGIDNIHRTADDGIRLQSGSPAINAGANSLIPAGITTDIIGAARIQNTTVDLGAYEGGVCPGTTTLYVDQSISSSSYGTSWDTALKTLDEALRKAHNCPNITTINVAAGTYKPNNKPYNAGIQITTPNARGVTFHLPNGVALYGGFPNGGGTRDIAANLTILSGDIGMAGNASDNAYHVVLSVNDAATTVLDGFTVSEGNANTASSIIVEAQTIVQNRGGGMYNSSSSPRITNTTFTGNSASQGGGMYNFSSSPSITNTTLTVNTGTEGSGMYNRSSSPTITNTTFTGNAAISNGGAMYNYESNPTITNATFTGNAANSNGGALYNFLFSNPTVSNSILWGNGTEIVNNSASATVSYSIVQGGYTGCSNCPGTNGNADPLFVDAANPAGPDGIHRTADAAGIYKPGSKPYENGAPITTSDARDVTFHLADGVAMYGGFPVGGGTRDIAGNPSILSGDFNGDDMVIGSGSTLSITGNGENAYHVVLSVSDDATTILDGFTVRGGNVNNSDGSITVESQTIFRDGGGGMYNASSSPSISNTTFTGNSASLGGGGMLNKFSSPSITNTTFTGNTGTFVGGGMFNSFSSSPSITNTTFTGNSATFGGGGGMYNNDSSSPSITNTTFTGNSATFGGGMYNDLSSNPMIHNSILWGNGTEITNSSSTPTVTYLYRTRRLRGHCPGRYKCRPPLCGCRQWQPPPPILLSCHRCRTQLGCAFRHHHRFGRQSALFQ
jgi:hypothetical protein